MLTAIEEQIYSYYETFIMVRKMFHKRPVVSIHLINCKFSDWIPVDALIQLTGYKEL